MALSFDEHFAFCSGLFFLQEFGSVEPGTETRLP